MRNTLSAPAHDEATLVAAAVCPDCTGHPASRRVHLLDLSADHREGYATICNGCCRVITWSIQECAA